MANSKKGLTILFNYLFVATLVFFVISSFLGKAFFILDQESLLIFLVVFFVLWLIYGRKAGRDNARVSFFAKYISPLAIPVISFVLVYELSASFLNSRAHKAIVALVLSLFTTLLYHALSRLKKE